MCARWNKKIPTISVGYLRFGAEVWMWKHKLWDLVSPFQLHQLHDPFSITANFRYLPSTKTPTSGHKPDDYVGVQFYPWFKFYFPLFQTHYHILKNPKTKENKIWSKDKIEPQQLWASSSNKTDVSRGWAQAGDKNAIKEFFAKYIVSKTLAADFNEHLTDIEMQKVSDEQKASGIQWHWLWRSLSHRSVVFPQSRWTWTLY